nr:MULTISPECIES: transposase [unclassified Halomonas]
MPVPRHRESNPNVQAFDIRGVLYRVVGTDLTQLSGIGSYLPLKLIDECGLDMTRWPTAKHFTSWLALSPCNKISGGKVLSSQEPSGGTATLGGGHPEPHRDCTECLLPPTIQSHWQCQSRDSHSTQDRRAILQHAVLWTGLPGS